MNFSRPFFISLSLVSIFSLLVGCGSSKKGGGKDMIMTVELKEPIKGICDPSKVYMVMSFLNSNQTEAKPDLPKEKILERFNKELSHLQQNPDLTAELTLSVYVNCTGKMVKSNVSKSSENEDLDNEALEVFNTLGAWSPAKSYGQDSDSTLYFEIKIENGVVISAG